MSKLDKLDGYLQNQNVQAFLGLLRDTEGTAKGADPYRVFGGSAKRQIEDLNRTPSFELWGFKQTDGKSNKSSASGAYQFLKSTWRGLQKDYGFSDFTPLTQDRAAVALLIENGALPYILKGDWANAVKKAAPTWASLPGYTYKQHARSQEYVMDSLSKHLGKPIDFAKYEQVAPTTPKLKMPETTKATTTPAVKVTVSTSQATVTNPVKKKTLLQKITSFFRRKA